MHAFAVGERDKTQAAEQETANAVCGKRIRHGWFTAYREPKDRRAESYR
jgi:hypothetical protein